MDEPRTPTSLTDAVRYFSYPDRCLAYVVSRRWPNGVTCPTCGSSKVHFLKNQRRWKCSQKHDKRQVSGKAIVFGMLERGGRVRVRTVPNVKRKTLEPHIHEHVEQGTEIHSDANPSYDRLDWMDMQRLEADYTHKVVDHAKTYVDGNV